MSLDGLFYQGLALGFACFLLYFTDAISVYGEKLKLSRFLRLREYHVWKNSVEANLYYPVFIRCHSHSFWAKLIGCPFCVITWGALFELIESFSIYRWLACAALGSACFLILRLLYFKNYTKQ